MSVVAETYVNTRSFLAPLRTATGKVQWLGLVMLGVIALLAIFAPLFTPYGPREAVCAPFETPSFAHMFGCDDAGHDLWSQLLYGARVSLTVGLLVAVVSTVVATAVAVLVGLNGGWIDRLVMRFVDVVLSLPFLPLVIVLGVYFGASITTQVTVIALVMWAGPVRELRAQILAIRASGFVEASYAMGANGWFVGTCHVLPELAPLIVPQFVRIAHAAILVETSLSFLGLGDPLQNSWGSILFHANARTAFLTGAWTYWIAPPGIFISLTVLSLAFIGFGYDASQAPRIKVRRATAPIPPADAAPAEGAVLTARGLRVSYDTEFGTSEAVRGVDITLKRGELVGLVGESGSGKTTAGHAVLRLLRHPARITHGAVYLEDADLLATDDDAVRALRGRRIALIPQSAMNALNPVLSIGSQLEEALARGATMTTAERKAKVAEWLQLVDLEPRHASSFAHELSGGMRQRAVIAIALCNTPEVVVADEPTTGLDVLVQEDIMALLLSLRQRLDLSILFITHNLPLIARHADRLAVIYRGEIVDAGVPAEVRAHPNHDHTRTLFESLPDISGARRWESTGVDRAQPVIELRNVSKSFYPNGLLGFGWGTPHRALNDVSLALHAGEKLGLVGGSGAGKSTIARLALGMIKPDSGTVLFNGADIATRPVGGQAAQLVLQNPHPMMSSRRAMRRAVHLVFQDPYQSLRNGMSIRDIVAEPLRIHGERDGAVIDRKVRAALEATRLSSDGHFLSRRPVQLSGGQRQRVAFARAVVTEPAVIVADEPTSMLDQSVRMEIMELMDELRRGLGTAFLFITHDIALARHFCDRLIVLQNGEIVEQGPADAVVLAPQHEYTRRLIAAA